LTKKAPDVTERGVCGAHLAARSVRSSPRSVRRCWTTSLAVGVYEKVDRESAYEKIRAAAAVAEAASNPNGGQQASGVGRMLGLNDMPFGSTGRVAQ
jgi:hypothetical protein